MSSGSTGTPLRNGNFPPPSYIDPASLMQIQSLELRAKTVVEGFFSGLHRSPYHGFSVEFTEYRQYVAGDDLRYLDWKLLGRSDRYYVKRFEDETNLRCQIVLDNSRSMAYGSPGYSKSDYGKTLAGTIAYYLTTQRDAVGLFRFSNTVDEYLPPRYRPGHLRRVLMSLEQQPEGNGSGILAALKSVTERTRKRGLLVLISDFLAPLEELEQQLAYVRATGSEVVIFHLVDPEEQNFNFSEPELFVDAETGREVYVDPQAGRGAYQQRFREHQQQLSQACQNLGVQLSTVTTDVPLEQVLGEFLRTRLRVTQTRRRG